MKNEKAESDEDEDDDELEACATERERHLLRIQKRLQRAKEADKVDTIKTKFACRIFNQAQDRMMRKAARKKSRDAEIEPSIRKMTRVDTNNLADLELAALHKLGLL